MTDDEWRQTLLRLTWQANLWMHGRLERLDELAARWADPDEPPAKPMTETECGEAVLALLRDVDPAETEFALTEAVHVSFFWRDREKYEMGEATTYEALSGDGFGFFEPSEDKIAIQFDCAGVLAVADMSYDYLRRALDEAEGCPVFLQTNEQAKAAAQWRDEMVDKVAELERELGAAANHLCAMNTHLTAANARAEAAEREMRFWRDETADAHVKRAESKAAALRAEVERLREELETKKKG